MRVQSYVSRGFDGKMVEVEADLRRGIPGMEIVGLPDVAVREARERVRAALRNSGFEVPRERILINLAPGGVKKEGASFDLPIAVSILLASAQLPGGGAGESVLVVGEIELSGRVRPVDGVLAAVASARSAGISHVLVPTDNMREAQTVREVAVHGIDRLCALPEVVISILKGESSENGVPPAESGAAGRSCEAGTAAGCPPRAVTKEGLDICDIAGQRRLKRAVEVAAAGGHHLLLFGPPGVGKTMAARRLAPLLPELTAEDAMDVTRIHSIAGLLGTRSGLITRPPLRSPHHTASREGLIGGADGRPGEISLAHRGVLFLDEALEFRKTILQSLREPIERGEVEIARAGIHYRYPSRFQLLLAANPCPCGRLGQPEALCMCSAIEIHRYWKKLGAALLDRVDMRVAVQSEPLRLESGGGGAAEGSETIAARVARAAGRQRLRYAGSGIRSNAELGPENIETRAALSPEARALLAKASAGLGLSSRAAQSVMRIARTVADLAGEDTVGREHVAEAVEFRRYGDGDYFWRAA